MHELWVQRGGALGGLEGVLEFGVLGLWLRAHGFEGLVFCHGGIGGIMARRSCRTIPSAWLQGQACPARFSSNQNPKCLKQWGVTTRRDP